MAQRLTYRSEIKNPRLIFFLPKDPKNKQPTNAEKKTKNRLFKINPIGMSPPYTQCILWIYPPTQDASHPQDYYLFPLPFPPPEITSTTAPVRDIWHDCGTYISWEFHWSLEKKGG